MGIAALRPSYGPGACDRCNQFRHPREIVLKQSAGNPRPYQRGSRRRHLIVTVHMRRRDFMTLIGGALAWPLAAHAQAPTKLYRIFWVSTATQPDPFLEGFRVGLRA